MWFQEDLPFPGVDLTKLKPKTSDSYPPSIEADLKTGLLKSKF
jgi:hypothetical protein